MERHNRLVGILRHSTHIQVETRGFVPSFPSSCLFTLDLHQFSILQLFQSRGAYFHRLSEPHSIFSGAKEPTGINSVLQSSFEMSLRETAPLLPNQRFYSLISDDDDGKG